MVIEYEKFLEQKKIQSRSYGIRIEPNRVNSVLTSFRIDAVVWAIRKGRCAVFFDTGLGKTAIQIEYARILCEETGHKALIIAPLSVARQTIKIARDLLGVEVRYVRSQEDAASGLNITNYEMAHAFNLAEFGIVILDESSILKGLDGKYRRYLTDACRNTPYRLCCTATPAPNDILEIANHAEFLGVMTVAEMKATFFVNSAPKDPITGEKKKGVQDKWRLRGHAREKFFRWLASWSMSVRKPSDIGYSDDGYNLPPLHIHKDIVKADYKPDNQLFFTGMKGIQDRTRIRQSTVLLRASRAAEIVNNDMDQWVVWCGLNDESEIVTRLIHGAVEVKGSDPVEHKIEALEGFITGKYRVLVTKAKIAGKGMNFQNCHKTICVGLGDSWEDYYQLIRRFYRFGQVHPVNVYIILSDVEEEVYANVMRKEKEAKQMTDQLIKHVKDYEKQELAGDDKDTWQYKTGQACGHGWETRLGDSVELMNGLLDNSIDLSVYSPPFQSLYTYTPTERDLGNSRTDAQFYEHYGFIIEQLFRVTKPGRVTAVHVADVPAMLIKDGYIGMKDFSGDVIRLYISKGWIFDGRVPIDKNQQAQSIRTHSKALTMSQLEKDRTWNRPALPDYILKFRKPGENAVPVVNGDITRDLWIEWASPTWPGEADRCADYGAFSTWYGIAESDTLQGWQKGREVNDERHVCPLQLGTIERSVRLWSNAGELVLDPFSGIGSTGYVCLKFNRRYIGIELKEAYWKLQVKNLKEAEQKFRGVDLFSWAASQPAASAD